MTASGSAGAASVRRRTATGIGAGLRTLRLAVGVVFDAGRWQVLAIIAATILTAVALAGQLLVGGSLIDVVTDDSGATRGDLAPRLVLLGALLVVGTLTQSVANELRRPLAERVYRSTMGEVLDVAADVELEQFERAEFYDRLDRAFAATGEQAASIVFGLVTIMSTVIVASGVVVVLVSIEPLLVPIVVIGYVPVAVVNARNTRATYRVEVRLTEVLRERTYIEHVLTERSIAKDVRSYSLAPLLRSWHARVSDVRTEQIARLVRLRLARVAIGSVLTSVVLIGALAYTFVLAIDGRISVGDAAVAIVGLQQLNVRVQALGGATDSVHAGVEFLRDLERFTRGSPSTSAPRPNRPPMPPAVIELDRVRFHYPGSRECAVGPVSLRIPQGTVLAIVGANGSGKTTLAKMICGLHRPTGGVIRWDGVDVAECDPALVRSQIAPVFQDYPHLSFTLRQVIGFGDVARMDDDSAVRRAAAQAGLEDLVDSVGLDARLGKEFANGIEVSIGQWQRLSIARALFRDAPVMVFDEPSAALDPRGEMELFDTMQHMSDGRIVVFISHRFATVRDADVVAVLDDGALVEVGSHDQLMAAPGLYAELFTLQADRYRDDVDPGRGNASEA